MMGVTPDQVVQVQGTAEQCTCHPPCWIGAGATCRVLKLKGTCPGGRPHPSLPAGNGAQENMHRILLRLNLSPSLIQNTPKDSWRFASDLFNHQPG